MGRCAPTVLQLALCWSHARRKFVEAEPHYPVCKDAIELIGKLFAIDRDTADPALLAGEAKGLCCADCEVVLETLGRGVSFHSWCG